jgi:hypothetical protein
MPASSTAYGNPGPATAPRIVNGHSILIRVFDNTNPALPEKGRLKRRRSAQAIVKGGHAEDRDTRSLNSETRRVT